MNAYLKEKIGDPDLFVGREKQLRDLLKWTEGIKREISMSRAVLSRRKTGKTALLQRLYNIVFDMDDGVVPFYYEITEGPQWIGTFCSDFFLNFVLQYTAFKTRNPEYIQIREIDFRTASEIVLRERLDYLAPTVEHVASLLEKNYFGRLWDSVREIPYKLAWARRESILQIVDEFQFLNSEIYLDQDLSNPMRRMASGYMRTAEYKNAPLLVSGSWVGWLMNDLNALPGRFQMGYLENMPESEIVEMAFKYSEHFELPITEETAFFMARLSEGNPFYVSSLFKSPCPDKRLDTEKGVLRTLEFETLDDLGGIKRTWMEYVDTAFRKVNDRHAKRIVLYLSKRRDREATRKEILDDLKLPMDDRELERKLKALARADVIERGSTNFDYRGVRDNVFDKVFRGVYQKEIDSFDPGEIAEDYRQLYERSRAELRRLLGKYNQAKGLWAEYLVIRRLRRDALREGEYLESITRNLPGDFGFADFESVWSYKSSPAGKRDMQIDVFARAAPEEYSVVGEVKSRDARKFSGDEARRLAEKIRELAEAEGLERFVGFVFSVSGFTEEAVEFLEEHGIAYSDDPGWLGD